MFKNMPKVFWVGMAIMYGWWFSFMILEMTVPGFPLKVIFGIPACYIYNMVFAAWIVPTSVALLFFVVEERREANLKNKGGA